MIVGVFGLPGSGKTTYLSKIARENLKPRTSFFSLNKKKPGRRVFSNFACKGCYKLDFADLGRYDFSDSVMLIDEISLVCDSRDWKSFNSDLRYFFTNHRHYNIDIYYCSQWFTDTDVKIRRMTEYLYYIEHKPFGLSMRYVVDRDVKTTDSGEVTDCYRFKHGRLFYRRPYYSMFDSFSRRSLPSPPLQIWEDV